MEKKNISTSHKKNLAKLESMKLNDYKTVTLKLVDELLDGKLIISAPRFYRILNLFVIV